MIIQSNDFADFRRKLVIDVHVPTNAVAVVARSASLLVVANTVT